MTDLTTPEAGAQMQAGEVIPPGDSSIRVTAKPTPFSAAHRRYEVQAGSTIAELVDQAIPDRRSRRFARVFLCDHEIPIERWRSVRPKPGTDLFVTVAPAGMGGGGQSNPLRMILQIAILAISIAVPYAYPVTFAGAAGALFTAATPLCGRLSLGQLQPPRRA